MKSKLIVRNMALIVISVLIVGLISVLITDNFIKKQWFGDLNRISAIYEEGFEFKDNKDYSEFANVREDIDVRVTVIANDGTVLVDSKYAAGNMTNHLNREEVQLAINGVEQCVIRKSSTSDSRTAYLAKKFYNQDKSDFVIFRVATTEGYFSDYLMIMSLTLCGVIVAVVTISIFISVNINKSVVSAVKTVGESLKALNNGTYTKTVPSYKEDELNKSFNEINEIQYQLNSNLNKLAQERDKLNTLLSSLDIGVAILEKDSKIVLLNDFANKIFKVNKDVTGKDINTLCMDEWLLGAIESVLAKNKRVDGELKIDNRSYKTIINIVGKNLILLFNDITELINYNEMKNEFFANASHELKTPITSILGFLELLEHSKSEEDSHRYIDRINIHTKRMQSLINDMLQISKLEGLSNVVDTESINIYCAVKNVYKRLEYQIDEKKITTNIDGESGIIGTQETIEELLENLISNAIRYNKEGGEIFTTITPIKAGVKISVKDNGIGIPKESISRVCERFYRVDKGRSKQNGGTGLGLSIVKHIVTIYNGKIAIKSELGVGTEITVTLYNLDKKGTVNERY